MRRLIETISICGTRTEVVILSPSSPLQEHSYREVHLKWNGIYYSAYFFLGENARVPIDVGGKPCVCADQRIYVADFKLPTLFAALEHICSKCHLDQCLEITEPFDTESVWVGVPVTQKVCSSEEQEQALINVQQHLLCALQCVVTFGLGSSNEDELCDWIRLQCKEIIRQYDSYEDSH